VISCRWSGISVVWWRKTALRGGSQLRILTSHPGVRWRATTDSDDHYVYAIAL
jgi:hypothetical protein